MRFSRLILPALISVSSTCFAAAETKEALFQELSAEMNNNPDLAGMNISLCVEDLCTSSERSHEMRAKKPDASGKGEAALTRMVDTIMKSTGGRAKLEIKYKQGPDGTLEWSIMVEGGWGSGAGGTPSTGFEEAVGKQLK